MSNGAMAGFENPSRSSSRRRETLHLHEILLHAEILDDELLPFGRVFAHEEGEQFVAVVEVVQVHRVEADVFADEVLELAGGDFAGSRDFHAFRDLPEPEERLD